MAEFQRPTACPIIPLRKVPESQIRRQRESLFATSVCPEGRTLASQFRYETFVLHAASPSCSDLISRASLAPDCLTHCESSKKGKCYAQAARANWGCLTSRRSLGDGRPQQILQGSPSRDFAWCFVNWNWVSVIPISR